MNATTGARLWSNDRLVPEDRWASSHLLQHHDSAFVSVETAEMVIAGVTLAGRRSTARTC